MSACGPIGGGVWVMSVRSQSSPRQLSQRRSRSSPARPQGLARRTVAAGVAVASALVAAGGYSISAAPASTSGVAVRNCLKQLACYSPQQFREAYAIQSLLDRGI